MDGETAGEPVRAERACRATRPVETRLLQHGASRRNKRRQHQDQLRPGT